MTDILTELRHEADREYPSRLSPLCGQAAAEIKRLRLSRIDDESQAVRELEAKDAEIKRLRQHASEFHANICAENDNIKAEIKRLRAARQTMFRCDNCNNGVEIEWKFCAWCGSGPDWVSLSADEQEEPNLGVDAKGNPHPF